MTPDKPNRRMLGMYDGVSLLVFILQTTGLLTITVRQTNYGTPFRSLSEEIEPS
jgi:hypothetical protein